MLLKSTQKFLRELYRIGAVKVDAQNGFRLALHDKDPSAPLSPFYINLRMPENKDGPLQPQHVESIATELMSLAARRHIDYDAIAGIPRAGTPFARRMVAISGKTEPKEYVSLRKTSATSRAMRAKERTPGHADRGIRRVLIVDDLITKADTKLTAIKAIQDAGYLVAGIVVYLDREQGGVQELRKMQIPAYAVVRLTEMLDFYGAENLISAKDLRAINTYLQR